MVSLKEIWKKRKRNYPLPGSIDDFVDFLGAQNQEQLETMDFTKMEQLPGVKDNVRSCGGNYLPAFDKYSWRWTASRDGRYQKAEENFLGRGGTYNEAALRGLLVYWELITFRKKQSVLLKA